MLIGRRGALWALAGALALGAGLFASRAQWSPGVVSAGNVLLVAAPSPTISVHVVFPIGAQPAGLAHYVEHLAWLSAIGADAREADRHSNAWASEIALGYWLSGRPEDLPELMRSLKRLFDPIDLEVDFALEERDIVLREYDFRIRGNPDAEAAEAMTAFLYAGTPLGVSVMGTPDQIRAFGYDAARAMHAATHRPEAARVVVVGDLSARDLRAAVRQADWPQVAQPASVGLPPLDMGPPAEFQRRYPAPEAAARLVWRRLVSLPAPVPFDLLEARAALLRDILDTSLPGGLAGPLRYRAAIARGFDLGIRAIDAAHVEISVIARPDRDVSLQALREAFEATLAGLAADGIPPATHARVLERFDRFWPDWRDRDETATWMADYVLHRVSGLREPLGVEALARLEDGLSLDGIQTLLQALAGDGRTAIAFIGPVETFE